MELSAILICDINLVVMKWDNNPPFWLVCNQEGKYMASIWLFLTQYLSIPCISNFLFWNLFYFFIFEEPNHIDVESHINLTSSNFVAGLTGKLWLVFLHKPWYNNKIRYDKMLLNVIFNVLPSFASLNLIWNWCLNLTASLTQRDWRGNHMCSSPSLLALLLDLKGSIWSSRRLLSCTVDQSFLIPWSFGTLLDHPRNLKTPPINKTHCIQLHEQAHKI